ncbi:MAG: DNA alkylation response protein, partial [Alphaproteobacteria bacterium]
MTDQPPAHVYGTHEVLNQPPPFQDVNLYRSDAALQEAVKRQGGGFADTELAALGAVVGSARVIELADLANRFPPELRTHDRFGNRIDEVAFHPA